MSEQLPDFNGVFGLTDPRNQMIFDLASLLHQDEWLNAGSFYAAYVRRTKGVDFANPTKKEEVTAIVTNLVHWCLNNDRYALAARLLWTDNLFDARPHFTQLIWSTVKKSASMMLMGSASASKSYSTGVWLLLDWIRDPDNTCVKLLGPSEKHLSENLFTHMVNLHQSASIPLPGETGDLWIGMDRKNKFGSISGVVVPLGRKAAGRLQGTKAGKRNKIHPIFGAQRRLRVFMDESEKIPSGIWKDVDNIFSNLSGVETFKIICAFNPENVNGESGTRCEPVGGWGIFDIDKDEVWRSKRGWDVVRLDGFKGENIIHKRTIFAGLQTWESINRLIENAGGYNSPGYYTMARAAFPPSNAILTVIPQGMAEDGKGSFVFIAKTTPCAGADMALEGGDAAPIAIGEFGYAIGFRKQPSLQHPQGLYVAFKDDQGAQVVRPAVQVNQIFRMETGDSIFMANQLKELCQKLGIKPEWLAIDTTGNGQGVYDILKNSWSQRVIAVNYSQGASEKKILEEDSKTCKEEYDRVCSELWFATRKWLEFHLMKFGPMVDFTRLFPQLTTRFFGAGKQNRVETKKEYKAHAAGQSPDEADALTLLVHAARTASGEVPSFRTDTGAGSINEEFGDGDESHTDVTNRAPEDLDE